MKNNFDKGHQKNIALFEDLISVCTAHGTIYNPSNANIGLSSLTAKHAAAVAALQTIINTKTALNISIDQRRILFEGLDKHAARIVSMLMASGAHQLTVDNARQELRKLRGVRAGKKAEEKEESPPEGSEIIPEKEVKQISVSHRSYDMLIEHFTKLVAIVGSEPLYAPNEADLTVASLNAKVAAMQAACSAVINTQTTAKNAIISRDKELYDPDTGLTTLAGQCKLYIKGLFGLSSPEFKVVSKMAFVVR